MRKRIHQYNNIFKEEYQKAIKFLKKGCKCGCSTTLPKEKFAQLRVQFQSFSKKEQDAFVMGQLLSMDEGETTTSSRFPKKTRTNLRTFYRWNNKISLCQETYLNMFGISREYLEDIRKHLKKGVITRTHGNIGRIPRWESKMFIDENVEWEIKDFLLNYAEKCGLPDPSGKTNATHSLVFLPTEMSYKSVHRDFINSRKEENELKLLKYETFLKLWHRLTPHIKFRSPRSDLCDTCQKFHRDLKYSCLDKETKKKNLTNTSNT